MYLYGDVEVNLSKLFQFLLCLASVTFSRVMLVDGTLRLIAPVFSVSSFACFFEYNALLVGSRYVV